MSKFRSALYLALLSALVTPVLHAAAPLLDPADTPLSEVGFADFNNDGRTDMALRIFATGDVRISYNIGNRFSAAPDWIGYARSATDAVNWDTLFADINGDGYADLVDRWRGDGGMCVHFNTGTDFTAAASCYSGFSRPSPRWRTFLAPIDSDARADLVSIDQQTGTVYVHHNNGAGFDTTPLFTQAVAVPSYPPTGWQQFVADCSGDGKADLLNLDQTTNTFFCHAYGTAAAPTTFAPTTGVIFPGPPEIYDRELAFGQFDGNGIADIVSHDLRTGEVVVLPVLADGLGRYTGHRALLRDRSPAYTRSAAQQRPMARI
ncbi:MAG TPA: VCBS repeat-containing protein, partial [Tahibacter sp.]|nr:VCBS repeat-containing protein [Tahibacter sp.]